MKIKKVILLILIIISIVCLINIIKRNNKENGREAQVKVDGQIVKTIKLKDESEIIQIKNIKLKIENSKVSVSESTCKDKICQRKGSINKEGEMIVCLPNKTVVEIIEGKN